MDMHQLTRELQTQNDSKIVLLVADGLGGLPQHPGGLTELEMANTPNLDRLAELGISGGSIPTRNPIPSAHTVDTIYLAYRSTTRT